MGVMNRNGLRTMVAVFVLTAGARFSLGQQEPTEPATDKPAEKEAVASAEQDLAVDQARLADRYKRLGEKMLQLAEFSATSDPRRAAVLRQAIAQSKESDIDIQFESVVKLLQDERLAIALRNQDTLKIDLAKLLEFLLKEDRANRIESEKRRITRLLKEVGRIIKEERGVKARTEGGDELGRVKDAQHNVTEKTGRLADELAEGKPGEGKPGEGKPGEGKPGEGKPGEGKPGEGKPGEGKPGEGKPGEGKPGEGKPGEGKPGEGKPGEGKPGEGKPGEGKPGEGKPGEGKPGEGKPGEGKPGEGKPGEGKPGQGQPGQGQPGEGEPGEGGPQGDQQEQGEQNVKKRIQAAQQRMKEAQQKLEEANRKGAADEQAKALEELEKAKAELEKILRQLREEEIERMLAMLEARFRKMLEWQIEVYEGTVRLDKVPAKDRDRDTEIAAGRLSRKEALIVREADRALTLLREEGSSVAFPEAVGQMRDDMEQVVVRLAQIKTSAITQGLEEDIIAALEEMIEALKKAQKDQEKKKQQQQQQQQQQPQDQPLVDILAEVKMIRALQMRVNKRTERYSQMIEGEQAQRPELLKALDRLSGKEERIHKVTHDLHLGRNK